MTITEAISIKIGHSQCAENTSYDHFLGDLGGILPLTMVAERMSTLSALFLRQSGLNDIAAGIVRKGLILRAGNILYPDHQSVVMRRLLEMPLSTYADVVCYRFDDDAVFWQGNTNKIHNIDRTELMISAHLLARSCSNIENFMTEMKTTRLMPAFDMERRIANRASLQLTGKIKCVY